MKLTISSLALLATFTVAASAQTTTHKVHITDLQGTVTKSQASKIPRVPGIPKTLYRLRYIDTVIGKGPLAETHKWYTVRYTGWLTDGTKFDSSYDHPGGQPFTFPDGAQRVIIGWDTGFEGMHVGGKRRLFVPYQLAYGVLGHPPAIPAKANLVFDVELVAMSDNPPEESAPTPPPADSANPATEAPPPQETKPSGAPEAQPQTTPHPEGL